MTKMIALFMIVLLVLSLIPTAVAEEQIVGGWTPADDPTVTQERSNLFYNALGKLVGVEYTPVAYLGSQVVAGTNHAFLCRAVTAYPGSLETDPAYAMVYLYEDLSGQVSILSIADFDVGSLCSY